MSFRRREDICKFIIFNVPGFFVAFGMTNIRQFSQEFKELEVAAFVIRRSISSLKIRRIKSAGSSRRDVHFFEETAKSNILF
jgi:hypothetical protein